MKLSLTRRYRFSASHRLHVESFSDARNDELYGKCNNPFGHGHNYVLDISVSGPLETNSGRVVDVAALDHLIQCEVITTLDQSNLNEDVPEFRTLVPTSENIALIVQSRLLSRWAEFFPEGPNLERVRLEETKRNRIEIK